MLSADGTITQGMGRQRHHRIEPGRQILAAAAAAVFALAPIEGYLMALHPDMGKLPAVLLFVAWGILRWRQKPMPRIHVVYVLLAIMATVVLVSTALHVTAPFATLYATRWIPFLVLTAVLVDVASTQVSIRLLLASAVAGATVASVGALYSVLILHEPRAALPNTDPNDLACALVAAVPLALAFSPRRLPARFGIALAVAAMTLAAVATLSRGGMLALAAVVAWVLLRRAVPVRAALCAGAVAFAIGLTGAYFARTEILQAWAAKQYIGQRNIDTRLLRWQAALRMFGQHPVLGVGPGGFRSEYAGASHLAELDIPAQQSVAHNMYLEVGAELGVIGLVVILGLLATAFIAAEVALRHGADRRVVVGVQASLIGFVVAAFFLSEQYFFSVWSMIAIACAIGIRAQYGDRL
jgi:putative inorganic carbon (HCO3(-)) transporter